MPATPAILDVGSELRLAAYRRFRLPHPITTIEFKPYGDSRLIERIIGIAWSPEIPNATTPEMSLPDGYRPVDGFFCASLIKTNDAARPFYLDPMFGFIAYHGPANPHSDAAPTVLFAAMPELTKNFTKARWSSHCASSHDFLGMTHEALVTYASSNEPVSLNG